MRKKVVMIMLGMILLVAACNRTESQGVNEDNLYIMETKVIEFEESEDVVIVESETGKLYVFNGIEDWQLNDRCVLLLDNRGTETIKDDAIIRTYYRR